jgi:hypothetical protein
MDTYLGGLDYLDALGADDPCFAGHAALDMMAMATCEHGEPPVLPPFSKTTIYGDEDATREAVRVLRSAFAPVLDADTSWAPATARELAQVVLERTNYEVVKISRIDNSAAERMQCLFGQLHGIRNTATVFHGTSHANADQIETQGLRASTGQRDKFGKGIYTASSVWEALAYAEPDPVGLHQCFFVATLLQGNTAVYNPSMQFRGVDGEGRPLHTTTNPQGTVFCAWYESQLHVTHRVTMRWLPERTHTQAAHNRICIYHPAVWERIKAKNTTENVEYKCHCGFAIGDTVTLQGLKLSDYKKFNGKRAVIQRIAKKKDRVVFYVEVDGEAAAVTHVNRVRNDQPPPGRMSPTWLPCFIAQLVRGGASASTDGAGSVLGKHGRE